MYNFKGVPIPIASTDAFPESVEESLVDGYLYMWIISEVH